MRSRTGMLGVIDRLEGTKSYTVLFVSTGLNRQRSWAEVVGGGGWGRGDEFVKEGN